MTEEKTYYQIWQELRFGNVLPGSNAEADEWFDEIDNSTILNQ